MPSPATFRVSPVPRPLVAGSISANGAATAYSVPLKASRATGTLLVFYQWYRSTTPGFTPSEETAIPGAEGVQ